MKKAFILSLLFTAFCTAIFGQTTLINPNGDGGFELGTTFEANGWTLVNNATGVGNNWRITNTTLTNAGISFAPTDSRLAFISRYATGNIWEYNINEYSTTHFYKDVAFPAGQEIINLSFRWNAKGEGTATGNSYDVLYVYLCPTTLTPVTNSPFGTSSNPTAWTGTGTATLLGSFHSCTSPTGLTTSIVLPASLAGTSQRLVFTWKNGNTLGVQPPASVDAISLTTDCPKSTVSINDLTPSCTNNVMLSSTITNPVLGGTMQWYKNSEVITGATGGTYSSSTLAVGDIISCIYSTNNACGYKDTATIVINYSVNDEYTEIVNLCSGDLPYFWRGILPIMPGTLGSYPEYATIIMPKADGCDSIITLDLTVLPQSAPITETISTCRNLLTGMTWRGRAIPPNAMSNTKFDSVRVASASGCDSLIYLNLQVIDSTTSAVTTLHDCYEIVYNGRTYKNSTTVVDTFRNLSNCDSFYRIIEIVIDNFEINIKADKDTLSEGEYVTLYVGANTDAYNVTSWTPTSLFANQSAVAQYFKAPLEAYIVVSATNANGCIDTVHYSIKSIKYEPDFAVPTAFSPNGDGLNDIFRPLFAMRRNFHTVSLEIYDRWGKAVYRSFGKSADIGWDGTDAGQPAMTGVYYYRAIVNLSDGSEPIIITGDVSLVR